MPSGEIDTDEEKIDELLARGVSEVIHKEKLKEKLSSGTALRIKLGIDPTSPSIHLGRAVLLLKLRDFQKLGHTVVFIVGDATGVIGDTSDKESERPMLSQEQVEKNSKTYFDQAGRILDMNEVERFYNSEWLNTLTYREIGEHADQFSVADFIARDNIKRRLDGGKRVSLREVLYPLMQGYDSIAVSADVEIGGTDQRFNLLAGRVLQEHFEKEPQDILMVDLISGTDGRKMSSSWGNVIPIEGEPKDMYGKVMSVPDSLVEQYFIACTRVPLDEVKELVVGGNPRDAKMRLAREIVSLFHGADAAEQAEEFFTKAFVERVVPSDIPEVSVKRETLLFEAVGSAVSSKSELRRLVEQGAVEDEEGNKVTDANMPLSRNTVFKIGKRRFVKVKVVD